MSNPRGTDDTNPATTPGPSRAAYVGLGVAAVVLGVATAVGVWLFNEAFGAAAHSFRFMPGVVRNANQVDVHGGCSVLCAECEAL